VKICTVEGCDRKLTSKIHCSKHHSRFRNYGDANFTKTAPTGEPLKFFEAALSLDTDECIDWPYAKSHGYGVVYYQGRDWVASRLMCERVNGPAPEGLIDAAHYCGRGDKGCINPKHIRWANRVDNSADKEIHGTVNNGTRNGSCKLSEESVIYIFSKKGFVSQSKLAKQFEVAQTLISAIHTQKIWKWLTCPDG